MVRNSVPGDDVETRGQLFPCSAVHKQVKRGGVGCGERGHCSPSIFRRQYDSHCPSRNICADISSNASCPAGKSSPYFSANSLPSTTANSLNASPILSFKIGR